MWSSQSEYCPVGHGAELAGDAEPATAVAIAAATRVARKSMCAAPFDVWQMAESPQLPTN